MMDYTLTTDRPPIDKYSWLAGYKAALLEYGVWIDGEQRIGMLISDQSPSGKQRLIPRVLVSEAIANKTKEFEPWGR